MHELEGRCHCGNVTVRYRTAVAPEHARVRACRCSFCRKHQSRAVTDPDGELRIDIHDPAGVNRYTFGLATAQFLVCRECGVYVAAFMPEGDEGTGYATLMASVLDAQARYAAGEPAHYGDEDAAARRARRRRMWTPAVVHGG